jgi:hypothetical protein
MARALERVWPGVVETKRRFKRPQHRVANEWRKFDTPLKLKKGIDLKAMPKIDEWEIALTEVKDVKSPVLRQLMRKHARRRAEQETKR